MNPLKVSNVAVTLADALSSACAEYEAQIRQKDELLANMARQLGMQPKLAPGLSMTEDERKMLGIAVNLGTKWAKLAPDIVCSVLQPELDTLAEAVRAYLDGRAHPVDTGSRPVRDGELRAEGVRPDDGDVSPSESRR